jgi:hypothetical protein
VLLHSLLSLSEAIWILFPEFFCEQAIKVIILSNKDVLSNGYAMR